MIKAVLYDLGDIFFEAHHWRKWMWEELSVKTGHQWTFSEFYDLYESWLKNVYEGVSGYKENYKKFLESLNISNIDDFMTEAFEKKGNFEKNRELFPGVKTTLRAIKNAGIMNIIMTDNEKPEELVRTEVLRRFSIDSLIDRIYTSFDHGMTKPDPSFFSLILTALKLKRSEAVFVGHDIDEINGAKRFGLTVIEFNNYLNNKTDADYRIGEFPGILETVTFLQSIR
jgi:HAD superfamily hydrolase (TIGR01509 family)